MPYTSPMPSPCWSAGCCTTRGTWRTRPDRDIRRYIVVSSIILLLFIVLLLVVVIIIIVVVSSLITVEVGGFHLGRRS